MARLAKWFSPIGIAVTCPFCITIESTIWKNIPSMPLKQLFRREKTPSLSIGFNWFRTQWPYFWTFATNVKCLETSISVIFSATANFLKVWHWSLSNNAFNSKFSKFLCCPAKRFGQFETRTFVVSNFE